MGRPRRLNPFEKAKMPDWGVCSSYEVRTDAGSEFVQSDGSFTPLDLSLVNVKAMRRSFMAIDSGAAAVEHALIYGLPWERDCACLDHLKLGAQMLRVIKDLYDLRQGNVASWSPVRYEYRQGGRFAFASEDLISRWSPSLTYLKVTPNNAGSTRDSDTAPMNDLSFNNGIKVMGTKEDFEENLVIFLLEKLFSEAMGNIAFSPVRSISRSGRLELVAGYFPTTPWDLMVLDLWQMFKGASDLRICAVCPTDISEYRSHAKVCSKECQYVLDTRNGKVKAKRVK